MLSVSQLGEDMAYNREDMHGIPSRQAKAEMRGTLSKEGGEGGLERELTLAQENKVKA